MWRQGLTIFLPVLLLASCLPEHVQDEFMLASESSRPAELSTSMCIDAETRETIRALMLEGLDTAFKEHIVRMFEVWMRDERGQPDRAKVGVRQGIKAYMGARQGALDWLPPECPT